MVYIKQSAEGLVRTLPGCKTVFDCIRQKSGKGKIDSHQKSNLGPKDWQLFGDFSSVIGTLVGSSLATDDLICTNC